MALERKKFMRNVGYGLGTVPLLGVDGFSIHTSLDLFSRKDPLLDATVGITDAFLLLANLAYVFAWVKYQPKVQPLSLMTRLFMLGGEPTTQRDEMSRGWRRDRDMRN